MTETALLDPLKALAFGSARLMAFFMVFALLDAGNVRGMVRGAVVLALAVMVAPMAFVQLPASLPPGTVVALAAKEVLLGVLLGVAASQLLWVVQSVGALIDQQTGIGTAAMIDPVNGHQEGPTPGFLNIVFVNLLLGSGGFLALMGAVFDSYALWPVFDAWPRLDERLQWLVAAQWRSLSELTVRLAAPVLLTLLLVELGLGLMQRYLTTLNVFFFSQALKILIAFFLLGLLLATLWDQMLAEMNPERGVRAIRGTLGY